MARLNEPAAPLDSLELLRKRFLRQNKEIIKINTDQSFRIRNLEAETSRLLSENITLREENLRLSHELQKGRHALALNNVGQVKDKLQAFAQNLSGLIAELAEAQSTLPETRPRHDPARRRSPKSSPKQSPRLTERQWRGDANALGNAEQEGRLPPIVEGKYYPRKTLDAQELGIKFDPSPRLLDSPDLGTPPVIHFDMGDPTKHDQLPSSPSPVKSGNRPTRFEDLDEESRPLGVNLETRKKRRTSTFAGDANAPAVIEAPQSSDPSPETDEKPEELDTAVKARGKRKFSMREDDEATSPARGPQNHKKPNNEDKSTLDLPIRGSRSFKIRNTDPEGENSGTQHPEKRNNTKPISGGRRALGEKPVNTDPVLSPLKARVHQSKDGKGGPDVLGSDKTNQSKPDHSSVRPDSRPLIKAVSNPKLADTEKKAKLASVAVTTIIPEPEVSTPVIDVISLPPPSPDSDALFAPGSVETLSSEGAGRPSRRSRPTISYAEPNLRDKMRRPTKELTDAVAGNSTSKRLSTTSGLIVVDAEGADDDAEENSIPNWGSKVGSVPKTLASKHEYSRSGSSTVSCSEPVEETPAGEKHHGEVTGHDDKRRTAESKVERIVGNSHRRLSRVREAAAAAAAATARNQAPAAPHHVSGEHEREQDIYDLLESSSPEANRVNYRRARRTISVPDKLNANHSDAGSSRKNGGRRRETMATNANVGGVDGGTEASQNEIESSSRADRMATRRRSMML